MTQSLGLHHDKLGDRPTTPFHTDVIAVSWVRLGTRFGVADEGAATRLISLVGGSGLSGASPHQGCRRRSGDTVIFLVSDSGLSVARLRQAYGAAGTRLTSYVVDPGPLPDSDNIVT
jgi:hypothetical protein